MPTWPEIKPGMTDADWNRHFELSRRANDEVLRPIREEAGFPLNPYDPDAWFGLDPEVTNKYIEALEAEVCGQARARETIRRART